MTRICVIGSWHLSSVMATCLAEVGHVVRNVHDDVDAIEGLQRGEPPVHEPDMKESIANNVAEKRLSFWTDYAAALKGIGIAFLSVDTQILPDGSIDLGTVLQAARDAAKAASRDLILVVASQVPVGTCDQIQKTARKVSKHHVDVVCNPEFLRLGGAMELQRHPDRVVLGADDPKVANKVGKLFEPFDAPIMTMGLRDAEIVKHAANAYVANSVSFIGEIMQVCDDYAADCYNVGRALKADRRIGRYAYVMPGLGFNGGTVRRDVNLIKKLAADKGRTAPLMQAILDVNERTNGAIVERLAALLKNPDGKKIGLLGLTYKAATSTLRHSLTLQIAEKMLAHGMVLQAFDPVIGADRVAPRGSEHEWEVPDSIRLCGSIEEAAKGAHALVVMTNKDEFKNLKLGKLGASMRRKILVDPVDFYDAETAAKHGFKYIALGKGYLWR